MAPKKQVSPAIRILRGERDASARATHLEAATRKFLVTTNERKQMSTTTNFKRIALVAVAALGFGVISAVPSSADVSGVTISVTNGATPLRGTSTTTVDADTGTATGAAVTVSYLTTAATDSVTVTFYAKNSLAIAGKAYLGFSDTTTTNSKVSKGGVGAFSAAGKNLAAATDSALATVTTFALYSASDAGNAASTRTTGNVGATFSLFLDTRSAVTSAGTYTYSVVVTQYVGTTAANMVTKETSADASIVVSAPSSASTAPSAATTTFYMGAAGGTVSTEATVTPKSATAGTSAAGFTIAIKNSSSNDALDTVTATVTGAGVLTNGTSTGRSIEVAQTGSANWTLTADGTAGVATVTFKTSVTGLTFTRTVNFYSAKAAAITASVFSPILKVGTNSYAVAVTAKDALQNAWTGTAWIYASTAADALIAGSSTAPVQCAAYDATTGLIICPIAGTTIGTAKFKVIDASTVGTANATSNEVTVSVKAATAASVKIAFNKATYAPGEKALVTVTPVAADGTNLPATTVTNALAAGGIKSSVQLGTSSASTDSVTITTSEYSSATSNLVAGSMTYVVYMPVVGGTVTLTATGGTGLPPAGQVALTATATVTDNGAAALAAVTALATTVASLKTLITTLTNLVLKIQKKVKA